MSSFSAARVVTAIAVSAIVSASPVLTASQAAAQGQNSGSPAPIERLGPGSLRIGNIRIDTARNELSVPGTVTRAQVLEFLAAKKGGLKAYESALELDTTATNFNSALLLIGLDNSRSVVPRAKFDPNPPKGDPVEIWVEWMAGDSLRRIRAGELIYNRQTKQTIADAVWVYTGSVFIGERYLPELDGTLIGFMHTPSTMLDNSGAIPGAYGASILNPALNLTPGAEVTVSVKAIPR